jgi:hypothetical protein
VWSFQSQSSACIGVIEPVADQMDGGAVHHQAQYTLETSGASRLIDAAVAIMPPVLPRRKRLMAFLA